MFSNEEFLRKWEFLVVFGRSAIVLFIKQIVKLFFCKIKAITWSNLVETIFHKITEKLDTNDFFLFLCISNHQ